MGNTIKYFEYISDSKNYTFSLIRKNNIYYWIIKKINMNNNIIIINKFPVNVRIVPNIFIINNRNTNPLNFPIKMLYLKQLDAVFISKNTSKYYNILHTTSLKIPEYYTYYKIELGNSIIKHIVVKK